VALQVFKALQHLKRNKHEVFSFISLTTSPNLLFDEERPYEFIDLENGEKLKLNPARSKREIYPSIELVHSELKLNHYRLEVDRL
jgi:hypothetical protein